MKKNEYFCSRIKKETTMRRIFLILLVALMPLCTLLAAGQTSELQQKAEAELAKGSLISARSHYFRAYEDYAKKGQMEEAVKCGVKATELYYKDSKYKEAFDLLRTIDQSINASTKGEARAALHYLTTKERMQMYMRLHKYESAKDQLDNMERHVEQAGNDDLRNDLLYNKAIYFYTRGQNAEGNAVFKEMAAKLTAQKEYDKVDGVYQTLIKNGRRSGSANLVAQSYISYMAWKDSVYNLKKADEIGALKRQIAEGEAAIADRDSMLSSRKAVIWGLGLLAVALAVALVLAIIGLMRLVIVTRRLKQKLRMANENIALKAKFISNISAQLDPTLQKLDNRQPEVRALQDFSAHIQMLSTLETAAETTVDTEDTQITPFCEALLDAVRDKVKAGVSLKLDAPKISAPINREYVTHILTHLLENAAAYTPENGNIWVDFKKRGPHAYQFIVSNTGEHIAEEQQENVFKPFLEVRDLTEGDGLGLPICRQMALNMNGELSIDRSFTRGTRFVLDLHA